MSWTAAVGAAASLIVPILVALLAARVGKAGEREGRMIDQLQEEVTRLDVRDQARETQVQKLTRQVSYLLRRDGLWELHAVRLEGQVEQLGGTPYPRPAALTQTLED